MAMSDIDFAEDSPNDESQNLVSEEQMKERSEVAVYHSLLAADSHKKHNEESENSPDLDDPEPPDSLSFKLSRDEDRIVMEGRVFGKAMKLGIFHIFLFSLYFVFLLSFFPVQSNSERLFKSLCPNGGCTSIRDGAISHSMMLYYGALLPTLGCALLFAGYVVFFSREKVVLSKNAIEIERTSFCRNYLRQIPLKEVRAIKETSCFGDYGTDVVTLGRRCELKSVSNCAEQAFLTKYLTNFIEKYRGFMKLSSHENLLDQVPGSRRISALRGEDDLLSMPPSDNRVKWNENEQCFIKSGQEIAYGRVAVGLVLSVLAAEFICWLYFIFTGPRTAIYKGALYKGLDGSMFAKRVAVVVAFVVATPIYFLISEVVLMWRNSMAETKWFVEGDTVSQHSSGLRQSRRLDWKISSVSKMELRWMGPVKNGSNCQYQLRLIGPANKEKCDMKGLTEGEARWIAFKIKSIQNCAKTDQER